MKSATYITDNISQIANISIHALHEECDTNTKTDVFCSNDFNPRTPWRVRPYKYAIGNNRCEFQSTHSMKSATQTACPKYCAYLISIHALHEECDCYHKIQCWGVILISIHALHEECDPKTRCRYINSCYFNPRTPWRVRHTTVTIKMTTIIYFNPRTPWRVRLIIKRGR